MWWIANGWICLVVEFHCVILNTLFVACSAYFSPNFSVFSIYFIINCCISRHSARVMHRARACRVCVSGFHTIHNALRTGGSRTAQPPRPGRGDGARDRTEHVHHVHAPEPSRHRLGVRPFQLSTSTVALCQAAEAVR